eukprot:6191437-Pleurochrysis_carterae.AAC.2
MWVGFNGFGPWPSASITASRARSRFRHLGMRGWARLHLPKGASRAAERLSFASLARRCTPAS